MVLFRQRGYIRAKMVVFWQSSCIGEKMVYLGKVVVFGKSGCIRAKRL